MVAERGGDLFTVSLPFCWLAITAIITATTTTTVTTVTTTYKWVARERRDLSANAKLTVRLRSARALRLPRICKI